MVLIDTSVWIDYLRNGDDRLAHLLSQGQVCIHPMIIGEIACGHLKNREELIDLLQHLPHVTEASHDEALFFLDGQQLMGKGIGWVDVHLLAATLLSNNVSLWTNDKRLVRIAEKLGVCFSAK